MMITFCFTNKIFYRCIDNPNNYLISHVNLLLFEPSPYCQTRLAQPELKLRRLSHSPGAKDYLRPSSSYQVAVGRKQVIFFARQVDLSFQICSPTSLWADKGHSSWRR